MQVWLPECAYSTSSEVGIRGNYVYIYAYNLKVALI